MFTDRNKKPAARDDVAAPTVLPPFYNTITPLFSERHKNLKYDGHKNYAFAADATAIVVMADEFALVERDCPIVFSKGDAVMPVALTGMPQGRNQFVSEDGSWKSDAYVPAYVRRYPFILGKLSSEDDKLTLCFDSKSELVGEEGERGALFADDKPTALTQHILAFCKQVEVGFTRTRNLVKELEDLGLLMDAKAEIVRRGAEPALFAGFQIVSEEKLKRLTEEQTQALAKSGMLALIHAHLLSLKNVDRLFARHLAATNAAAGTEWVA